MINAPPEEFIVSFILNNSFLFSVLFGTLGGLVHALDSVKNLKATILIKRALASGSAAILVFFISYDVATISPSFRIAISFIAGYLGAIVFRRLAEIYFRYGYTDPLRPAGDTKRNNDHKDNGDNQ